MFSRRDGKFDQIIEGKAMGGMETLTDAPNVDIKQIKKKSELALSLDQKRLELLQMKRDQMAARQITDAALETRIAELAERLRSYVAPVTPPDDPTPRG